MDDNKDMDDENDKINTDDKLEGVLDYNEEEGSELSTTSSSDNMSESEDTDEDEQQEVQVENENETVTMEKEEPLYEGSKISKVLTFVLIVTYVLKHNLSKAAWADLLRLLTTLLGERCKKLFNQSTKFNNSTS